MDNLAWHFPCVILFRKIVVREAEYLLAPSDEKRCGSAGEELTDSLRRAGDNGVISYRS